MDRSRWAPPEVDTTRPSVARVYDFYLGGSHNFESDRAFGRAVLGQFPELVQTARDNRAFLRRAVARLSAEGIDQFLDLGSGIPTAGNVHEIALESNPAARVVYVDHDPVAVLHSREIVRSTPGVTVVSGDLCEPEAVLRDAVTLGGLDLHRPVAVLLVSVLHFVGDERNPAKIIAGYLDAMVPGSHLVLSHARSDGRRDMSDVAEIYRNSRNPMHFRSHDEVRDLFGTLTVREPGIVPIPRWHPDSDDDLPPDVDTGYPGLCGVARRDEPA